MEWMAEKAEVGKGGMNLARSREEAKARRLLRAEDALARAEGRHQAALDENRYWDWENPKVAAELVLRRIELREAEMEVAACM